MSDSRTSVTTTTSRAFSSPLTKREIQISKALSKLLRHKATSENLPIDSQGFIKLPTILNHNYLKSNHATIEDIIKIVDSNDKKRFKLVRKTDDTNDSAEYYITAVQGHSISQVVSNLIHLDKKVKSQWPPYIIHGTYRDKLELIKSSNGISKMSRNHIHFTYNIPKKFEKYSNLLIPYSTDKTSWPSVISGIRASCQILIFLDIDKIRNSNELEFYKSENNVILSSGNENGILPLQYISHILDIHNGLITLNNDSNNNC